MIYDLRLMIYDFATPSSARTLASFSVAMKKPERASSISTAILNYFRGRSKLTKIFCCAKVSEIPRHWGSGEQTIFIQRSQMPTTTLESLEKKLSCARTVEEQNLILCLEIVRMIQEIEANAEHRHQETVALQKQILEALRPKPAKTEQMW